MRRSTSSALILIALIAVAWLAVAGSEAWAHAVLVETQPPDKAHLEHSPHEIVLRFNEPVRPIAVKLIARGQELGTSTSESLTTSDATVRLAVKEELRSGTYVVSYRVTSLDGHPVSGSFVFGVATDPTAMPSIAPEGDRLVSWLAALNRAVHFGALLTSAGGALFILLVLRGSPSMRKRLWNGLRGLAALAAITLVLALAINGAELAGVPAQTILTIKPWSTAWSTTLRDSAIVGLGGLILIVLGTFVTERLSAAWLGIGSLLALSSLALTGHAAAAPPRAVSVPAVYLHGLAAAFWLGAFWPLLVVLRHQSLTEGHRIVQRFSQIAIAAVAVLVVAGSLLSFLQLGGLSVIISASYGRIWLFKIALVVVLLTVAVLNRKVVTPRLLKANGNGTQSLGRNIKVELGLAFTILAATSLLQQSPPPRSLLVQDDHHAASSAGATAGTSLKLEAEGDVAELHLHPGMPGANHLMVVVKDSRGKPLPAKELTSYWALPEAGIEPLERRLESSGGGTFMGTVELPQAGQWSIRLDALVSDFKRVVFRSEITIGTRN